MNRFSLGSKGFDHLFIISLFFCCSAKEVAQNLIICLVLSAQQQDRFFNTFIHSFIHSFRIFL